MSDSTVIPGLQPVSTGPSVSPGLLAGLIAALPDAVLCLNRDWYITYANAEAIRISHLRPELFPTGTFWQLYPDLCGTEMERRYRAAMVSRLPDHFEFLYNRFGVWVDIHILPTDEGFALFYRDVTLNKHAEVRETIIARQLRQSFESIPDGVVIIDSGWRFTFANSRALDMLGRSDIIGQNIFALFPGNNEDPFSSSYRTTMATRQPTEFEAFYGHPLNVWFKVQAKPYDDGIIVFFSNITERKQAEHREQDTARRLAQVLEVTSDAVVALDRNWCYTYVNSKAEKLLGPANRLLGKDIWRMFPESVGGESWKAYHRSMNEGVQAVIGSYYSQAIKLWLYAESQPTSDGIVIFFRDITEQKLHDDVIRHQQELLATVQHVARLATWELDLESGRIAYGPGSHPILGHPLDQVDTLEARDRVMLPGFPDKVRAAIQEAIDHDRMMAVEFAVKSADGTTIWVESRGRAVPSIGARPTRMRGMSIDVTTRKLDHEELLAEQTETERRRAELETIYRTTPIGLALLDPVKFTFLNLNDREAEMLGFPKDQLLGRPLSEVAPPDKLPGLMEMMHSVAAGNFIKDRLLEGELTARPGEPRAWSVNYSPIFNEDGTVRAISSASIEITNQKKAEAALIQSEKLAAVGRLASSISHEINNPLEAITNLLYIINMDQKLPDDLKGLVHMAQSELSRVSQIATQTLRFHRQAVNPTPVSAEDLVSAVIRLYTGRLTNSHIYVDANYTSATEILCFENDIRQVLNNLIANAIDAMRTGGRLLIRAHDCNECADGRAGVRITIADTGHGMSQATLKRLFEPFFTTKDLNGTGLGLWISAGIVERHQGKLRVRSSDNPARHGTVFTLFLPCNETPTQGS